jgi:rod shape-determining protein MreD
MFWGNNTFSKFFSGAIVLFVLITYHSLLSDATTIWKAQLDLGIIILVYVSLTRGPNYGMAIGFAIGLLMDLFTPSILGWSAMVKCSIGFALGSCKDNLYLESLYSKGAVIFLALILNDLLYYLFLIGATAVTFTTLIGSSLPSAVYTALVGMLIFLIMNRLHWEKWSMGNSSG